MVDQVSISNLALSTLGTRSTIESLDENTPEAQQAKQWYDHSLTQALQVADWNFARKRQTLALHADDPPSEWGFRYQYPSDCLTARYIVNPGVAGTDLPAFKVETSDDGTSLSILTSVEDAILAYTFNQTLAFMFTPFFVEMLSYLLAHHMAFSITGKQALRESMLQIYFQLTLQAPAHNANEGIELKPRDAEHIRER